MMDLEQDAMLTAIGQMSMEQAREKWADRWSEFVQSMTRWKSVHTLLRLARLNAERQKLADRINVQSQRIDALLSLQKQKTQILLNINAELKQLESLAWKLDAAELKSNGREIPKWFPPTIRENSVFEAPMHRGKYGWKKGYRDSVAAAIEAAFLTSEYETAGGDKRRDQLKEMRKDAIRELNYPSDRDEIGAAIHAATDAVRKRQELQDEYDITKPYAMGLLVADIFKSMAMAIEGEIY